MSAKNFLFLSFLFLINQTTALYTKRYPVGEPQSEFSSSVEKRSSKTPTSSTGCTDILYAIIAFFRPTKRPSDQKSSSYLEFSRQADAGVYHY